MTAVRRPCWPARCPRCPRCPAGETRPRVDAAAAAAGRDPTEIVSVYNFGGRITPEPLTATRGEDGRWIGGSVRQWADELTTAVLEHHAAGFIYRSPADQAQARWATEIVPRRPRSDHLTDPSGTLARVASRRPAAGTVHLSTERSYVAAPHW